MKNLMLKVSSLPIARVHYIILSDLFAQDLPPEGEWEREWVGGDCMFKQLWKLL